MTLWYRCGLVLCVVLAACANATIIGGATQLCFSPCTVEVEGILISEEKFGPPNFGETPDQDARLQVFIIQLDRPVDIVPATPGSQEGDAMSGVRRVQLEVSPLPPQTKSLVSRRVVARGQLRQAILPTHFEPVVLTVESIRSAD